MFAWSSNRNYVYIFVGSKLETVMLKLAREGPFYRTWPQSKVHCTLCASMTPSLWVPCILGTSFYIFTWVMCYDLCRKFRFVVAVVHLCLMHNYLCLVPVCHRSVFPVSDSCPALMICSPQCLTRFSTVFDHPDCDFCFDPPLSVQWLR